MWASILTILNVALQVSAKVLDYLAAQKLRQDGQREQRLADLELRLKELHHAREIDAQAVPRDKPTLLDRL